MLQEWVNRMDTTYSDFQWQRPQHCFSREVSNFELTLNQDAFVSSTTVVEIKPPLQLKTRGKTEPNMDPSLFIETREEKTRQISTIPGNSPAPSPIQNNKKNTTKPTKLHICYSGLFFGLILRN